MVTAKWMNSKFKYDIALDATLGDLRALVAQQTGLSEFKLVHSGAVMKDDSAPLSAYKIRASSTIAIIGSADRTIPGGRGAQANGKERQSPLTSIHSEMDTIRGTLIPELDAFVQTLSAPTADSNKEHSRLSELLLQSLLRLDAVNCSDDQWEDARKERKAAVKEVQGLLDRLDSAWRARV